MSFFESSSWKGEQTGASRLPKCGSCGLWKNCNSPKMKPSGDGTRKILFVGEAPGEQEDKRGTQFVGDSGDCLRRLLASLDFDLDDAWKTNASACRPPGNKIELIHIESCRPNVTNAIRDLKPNVIVLLGHSAVKSAIQPEWHEDVGPISRWVGWQIPSPTYKAWLCPTYHPSFLIRSKEDPTLMKITRGHLKRALALEEVPCRPSDSLSSEVEVITDPRMGAKRIEALVGRGGELAWDLETSGLKPERKEQFIYTVSFCHNGTETFATPVTEVTMDPLRRVITDPSTGKIASNLKFESRWAIKKLGVTVANWIWDTMLGAHVLDNRPGICSIKFQGYVHLGVEDYSSAISPYLKAKRANDLNTITQAPLKDLLVYNGVDSLLEYRISVIQRKAMGML